MAVMRAFRTVNGFQKIQISVVKSTDGRERAHACALCAFDRPRLIN